MSQNEARIKLSVDTSQAQQQVKNLGRQVSEIGSGPSPNVREAMGEGAPSGSSAEDSVNSQRKLVNSLEDYLSGVEKSNEKMLAALDSIEQYLRGNAGGGNGAGGGSRGGSKTSGGTGGDDFMGKLSKTLFSMQAISSAISATLNYVKSGAASAQTNEMAAYKAYGTTRLYDNYSTARNDTSHLGLPLGYNASESIAVASGIIGGTGSGTQSEIQSDITAILRTARGLNVDENMLTSTATGFYQTGTYNRGQMNQFANLFGTLVEESGMAGREDETLDVLNAIHTSLKENLTNITESQYESTLGLYSLMAEYNSNYQGAKGSNIMESLNSFITGDSTGLNVALGWGTQYQGWGGYWQLAQQKEQGLGNPENLKSILETFNAYSSYDIGSEEYMGQLYKYLNSSFGADTQFTQFIADNMDTILSGNYSSDFSKALAEAAGTELIDENISRYEDTNLATKNQYDAEKANAAEETSSSIENAFGWFQDWYNGLPPGVQSMLSIGGGIAENLGTGAAAYGGFKGLKWLGGKLSGGTSGLAAAPEVFASYIDEIVDTVNGGGDIDGLLAKFSKNGKVTDDMYKWVDEVVDAYNAGGDNIDELIAQGYKQYGKAFNSGTSSSGSFLNNVKNFFTKGSGDEILEHADDGLSGLDDGLRGLSGFAGKLGKGLGVLGIGLEVGTGIYDFATAEDAEEKGEAVGGTAGSLAGGAAGAKAGGAIGTMIAPGLGTAIGAIIGGIGGALGGDWIGDEIGGKIAQNFEDAENNYGTWAAGLPIIGGLWRKDGTLIDQQHSAEQAELESRYTAGKPSDYGLPEEFDDIVSYYENSDGRVVGEFGQRIRHQLGYSDSELEDLYNSQAWANWMDAQGLVKHIDTSNYGNGAAGDFGIETDTPQMVRVAKDWGDYTHLYDASKDTLGQGYYNVWTGTQEELEDYKANRGSMMVSSDYWDRAETVGATEENPYIQSNTESTQSLTESIDELNATVEDMRDWLEQNGYSGTAAYSDEGVRQKYVEANSPSSIFGTNSTKTSTPFSLWRWNLLSGSHATGNDYVPYDGYVAELHKGEAVLDKVSADEYRSGSTGGNTHNTLEIRVTGAIEGMTDENQAQITKAVIAQIQQQANLSNMMNHLGNGTVRFAN